MRSPSDNKTIPVLTVHESTLQHLDVIEKYLLDALIQQGRVRIVPDEVA
jgi:hypothetical protein